MVRVVGVNVLLPALFCELISIDSSMRSMRELDFYRWSAFVVHELSKLEGNVSFMLCRDCVDSYVESNSSVFRSWFEDCVPYIGLVDGVTFEDLRKLRHPFLDVNLAKAIKCVDIQDMLRGSDRPSV